MTREEFFKIRRTLKASFLSPSFMTEDALDVWFNQLNRYDFKDIEEGVNNYIVTQTKTPTIRDITERIELARKERLRKLKAFGKATNTIRCKECNDLGFTIYWKDADGHIVDKADGEYEYMKPCRCERGREGWPEDYKLWYETKREN